MSEIKCPHCNSVFTIDENEYAQLLQQVRDEQFRTEVAAREKELQKSAEERMASALREKEAEHREKSLEQQNEYNQTISSLEHELELSQKNSEQSVDSAVKDAEAKMQKQIAEKEAEISKLEERIEFLKSQHESDKNLVIKEKESAFKDSEAKANKTIADKDAEIANLQAQLDKFEIEKESELTKATSEKDAEISKLNEKIQALENSREVDKALANAEKENSVKESEIKAQQTIADKDAEILKLNERIDSINKEHEAAKALAVKDAEQVLTEQITKVNKEKDDAVNALNNEKLVSENKLKAISAEKDAEIASLKTENSIALQEAKTESLKENQELLRKLEVAQATVERKDEEIKRITEENKLQLQEKLADKDKDINELKVEIERVRDMKAKLSTKMLGETLEQHCEIAFNQIRMAGFPRAEFHKDNDASSGTKGDYIFRDFDEDGNEILSIMFEMKNEADDSINKKKNSDHFGKLDKDRTKKNCEYAVLVSTLEADNDYYNAGIVDVSYEYPKMYAVRPQCFIPIITILHGAAKKALKYKNELQITKQQNIDVTNFEKSMEDFKRKFGRDYNLASNHFKTAMEDIDKTIKMLEDIKESFRLSEKHYRLANDKLEGLTIRKLTYKNPTMKQKFLEARENETIDVEVIDS